MKVTALKTKTMNAPSNAVLALIKASRPVFRSYHDKVAFACHGVAAINGLRLIAVGPHADSQDLQGPNTPEVAVDGWNETEGEYAFRYMLDPETPAQEGPAVAAAAAAAGQTTLLLKCLPVDDGMFVTVVASGPKGTPPPGSLELNARYYAVPEGVNADTLALSPNQYGHLPELVSKIQRALESQLSDPESKRPPGPAASPSASDAPAATTAAGSSSTQAQGQPQRSPLLADDDYYNDRMPGGGDPMQLGGPQRGSMPFGPGGGLHGGGMHVGPDHPMFSGRVRHPAGGLNAPGWAGGHPGGARWDPISPEGLPGFQPTDFQRGQNAGYNGPPVHPDMMQPGAGRGVDWDSMYS